MRKKGKNGIVRVAAWMVAGVLLVGTGSSKVTAAQDYTIAEHKAIMYATDKTVVYAAPDFQATIITGISADLPVDVTGITSNGWFRIDLKGTYYIPGYGLKAEADKSTLKTYTAEEITKLTSGTFSLFKTTQLNGFDKEDVEEMDANTYLKYLDSYLMGMATIDNCILEDSGLTLKETYAKETISGTMKDYLVNYRNQYLENSFWGPVRTEEELKVTVNRAIRYGYKEFSTVYKNANVGSESTKMESVLNEVIADIKTEQGIIFACDMDYGSFQDEDGKSISGWILEFTRKEK